MLDNAIKYSHGVYQLALHRRAMLHRFYNNRPDLAFRDYRTTYLHLPSAYHLLAEVSPVYLLGHVSDSEPQIFFITITLVPFACHLQTIKCGLLAEKIKHVSGLLQKRVPQAETKLWSFIATTQLHKASDNHILMSGTH